MRNFGYNDELSLTIPKGTGDGETLITGDEHRFLTDTFEVFRNEAGVIGAGSCKKIFAVLQDEKVSSVFTRVLSGHSALQRASQLLVQRKPLVLSACGFEFAV